MQCIEILPMVIDGSTSFIWRRHKASDAFIPYPCLFSGEEYTDSYLWHTSVIKRLIFLSLATWGALSQEKILSSLGVGHFNKSVLSSVSSNLDAGKRSGFYIKQGHKKEALFSLSDRFGELKEMRYLRFPPSQSAVDCARKRARIRQQVLGIARMGSDT
jgi:hypothetical protein